MMSNLQLEHLMLVWVQWAVKAVFCGREEELVKPLQTAKYRDCLKGIHARRIRGANFRATAEAYNKSVVYQTLDFYTWN